MTINGALGHCTPLSKSKPFVSDKVIGKGRTNTWYLGSLDTNRTLTFAYETNSS